MKPNLHLHATQHMAMTPQLLQSIRLLQLSSLELEQEIRQALESNVLLEQAEDDGADDEAAPDASEQALASEEAARTDAPVTGCDAAAPERIEADFDWSSSESWSGGEPQDDDERPWDARHAAPVQQDARLAALEQLQLTVTTPREARIVAAILEGIDDNGYLEQPLEGVALEVNLDPPATMDELEAALAKVQAVEPTGFGARSLTECLLLQLRTLADTPARDLAEFIVSACLERLDGGNLAEVREALGADIPTMREAVGLILSLNPKPASSVAAAAESIVPDLSVSGARGVWKVELNAERLPRVRVNRLYERLLAQGATHRAMREQLQEARWLVRGLEMRHETLLRTARVVFERQRGFLERGEVGMVSLTLREVADAIGMHESTVCRVTSNKWVQTPWGVYELKAFFPSQIAGSAGAADTSGTAVKAMIRRIIDGESRNSPLCDGDIAAILARNGVKVARRTVAKYREAMRIPSAKERGVVQPRARTL